METALHTAVRTRDVNVVALLTRYKADPSLENNDLQTPLMIAAQRKDEDIIELLCPSTHDLVIQNLHTHHGPTKDVVNSILNDDSMFDDSIFDHDDNLDHEKSGLS